MDEIPTHALDALRAQIMAMPPARAMQLRVAAELGAIPEISANKYLLWIRFTSQDGNMRPKPFEGPVEFRLALCNL